MFYPTRRQTVVGSILALGASAAISLSGALDSESSKSPERLTGQANDPAWIEIELDSDGTIPDISMHLQVETCTLPNDALRRLERGVPPALGDLACIGNAQVAKP